MGLTRADGGVGYLTIGARELCWDMVGWVDSQNDRYRAGERPLALRREYALA